VLRHPVTEDLCLTPTLSRLRGNVRAGPYDARADLLAAVQGELLSGGCGALGIGASTKEQLLQFLQPYVAHWQRLTGAAQ